MKHVDGITRIDVAALVRLQSLGRVRHNKKTAIRSPLQGGYRSRFKGRGMEFSESRLYQPTDDIRTIDWRVTARTGKTHTKLFEEERERPVFCLVDYRQPMFFATQGRLKSILAAELASLIGWRAHFSGDKIGGIVFSEHQHTETKPGRGKNAMLHWIHELSSHNAWHNTTQSAESTDAFTEALIRLRKVTLPGSLIYLISDFRHLSEAAHKQLMLLSQHNYLVFMHIYDTFEHLLPVKGQYPIIYNQKKATIQADNKDYRAEYTEQFEQKIDSLQQLSITVGGQFYSVPTHCELSEVFT